MTKAGLALLVLLAAYVTALLACYFVGAFGIERHHLESASFILVAMLLLKVSLSRARDDGPATPVGPGRFDWLVVVVAAGAYAGAVSVGLLSDDYVLRSWALGGRLSWENGQFVRPVPLALWRLVWLAGGGAPTLHILSIVLHVVNTVLAARVAARIGLARKGMLVAAAVFFLWPTQVEPVVWAAGLFDVLAATWMLLALLVCLREEPLISLPVDGLAAAGLTILALLTKESGVALLALMLLTLAPVWARARRISRRHVILVTVTVGVTAGYLLWRLLSGLPLAGATTLTRYAAKEQLSRTFASLVVPLTTDAIHAFPAVALLFAVVAVLAGVAAVLGSPRRTTGQIVAVQGLLWCVVAAAPTLGFLIIGSHLEGSRYLYLAAFGWGLTLGGVLESSPSHPAIRRTIAVLLTAIVVAAGVQQHIALAGWRAAAVQRDRMLAEAARLADSVPCGPVTATGLPLTFQGAQLFNNGFAEALQDVRATARGPRDCQLAWSSSGFAITRR